MALTLDSTTDVLFLDTTNSAGVVTLPLASSVYGRTVVIKDAQQSFQTHSLTIQTTSPDTFEDGTSQKVLSTKNSFISLAAGVNFNSQGIWYINGGTYLSTIQLATLGLYDTSESSYAQMTVSSGFLLANGNYVSTTGSSSSSPAGLSSIFSTVQGVGSAGYLSTVTTQNENFMVAVGGGIGTPGIAYSYDGIIWTSAASTGGITYLVYGIAWNGSLWVAGGAAIAYSYDGINWNAATSTEVIINQVFGIAWNGSLWVAVGGSDTTAAIAYSYDGINWSPATSIVGIIDYVQGIAWNGSLWVAGGGVGTTAAAIAYSYDGIQWIPATSTGGIPLIVYGIAWNGSLWVAGGGDSITAAIAYSYDGINWSPANSTGGILEVVYGIASRRVLPYVGSSPVSANVPLITSTLQLLDQISTTCISTLYNSGGSLYFGTQQITMGNRNLVSTAFLNTSLVSTVRGLGRAGYISSAASLVSTTSNFSRFLVSSTSSIVRSISTMTYLSTNFSTFIGGVNSSITIKIGSNAGNFNQLSTSIAIGLRAGYNNQGTSSIAIGYGAGYSNQGAYSIAIGPSAGASSIGQDSVIMNTGASANSAYYDNLIGSNSVALIPASGKSGNNSVVVGISVGFNNSVALGCTRGVDNSVFIGGPSLYEDDWPVMKVYNNIIQISARFLSTHNQGTPGLYIIPVRSNSQNTTYSLYYDTIANEVTYTSSFGVSQNSVTSSIQGLGSSGYVSSFHLVSTFQGLNSASYVNSYNLQSTIQGLGSSGYVSTSLFLTHINSTVAGLGTASYISSSALQSSILGTGTSGYISTSAFIKLQFYQFS